MCTLFVARHERALQVDSGHRYAKRAKAEDGKHNRAMARKVDSEAGCMGKDATGIACTFGGDDNCVGAFFGWPGTNECRKAQ
jgi:hypothetical protein